MFCNSVREVEGGTGGVKVSIHYTALIAVKGGNYLQLIHMLVSKSIFSQHVSDILQFKTTFKDIGSGQTKQEKVRINREKPKQ